MKQPVLGTQARRRRRHAAGAMVPLCLAVTVLAAPAGGTAAQPTSPATRTTHPAGAAATTGTASGSTVTLPGLSGSSYTVTLISGDQLRLTATGGGRYALSTVPAPGSSSTIIVHAHSKPGGASTIQAMPLAAQGLVGTGHLDPGLFDINYLVAHGDTRPGAQLPVTLQYAGHPAAATLRADADRLPGTRVVGMTQGSGEIDLDVAAARASAFWAALTGRPRGTAGIRAGAHAGVLAGAHLTGGVTKLWLTNHRMAATAAPRPQDAGLMSTVTVTVTKQIGAAVRSACNGPIITVKLCLPVLVLAGIAGPGAGQFYSTSFACLDQDPCTVQRFIFSVPNGIYSLQGFGDWYKEAEPAPPADSLQTLDLVDPQVTVAGDTSMAINADAAQEISISTPRPAQAFNGAFGESRELPDGQENLDVAITGWPYLNYWATPAAEPVTVGAFHFDSEWALGEPPVAAAITTPEHLELHPLYPLWYNTASNFGSYTRFSGEHAYPVVDGGDGQQGDFAKINAQDKLVLLRLPDPALLETDTQRYFTLWENQLTNALAAGAAGVLYNQQYVGVPWEEVQYPPVDIPVAGILPSEADTLRSLLGNGPVDVTVADHGQLHYLYALNFDNEGRVPASLHYTLTSRQLATRTESFHTSQRVSEEWYALRPNEHPAFIVAPGYDPAPARLTEYFGPESSDLLWQRFPFGSDTDYAYQSVVFDQHGGSGTDDWYVQPTAPGAPETPFAQAQPGRPEFFCVNCRQGNTFLPFVYDISGAGPETTDGGFAWALNNPDIHLYDAAGNAIPPTAFGTAASYQLPPQQARYKLVAQAGDTSSTWDFTSSAPAADHTPPGTECPGAVFGISTDPCQADPLVYLRYNAFTDLSNAVTAPGTRQLEVTAYHQTAGGPPITALSLSISTDGGSTWRQLTHGKRHGDTYVASYTLPMLDQTSGTLSIKASAADADGNDISQTMLNAVDLVAPDRTTSH